MNIEAVNDRQLATAGDDIQEADLWDIYMEQKAADFRKAHGWDAVPSKELIKEWVKEAQAFTENEMIRRLEL